MTRTFDQLTAAIDAGDTLTPDDIATLAHAPDILALGMLADALRRRLRGATVTYARVAHCACNASFADAVPPAAREVRITGHPETIDAALAAVVSAKAVAGDRLVSGFSWLDIDRLVAQDGQAATRLLERLRAGGLEALAEIPLDQLAMKEASAAIERLAAAGFQQLRLTIEKAPAAERTRLVQQAAELQSQFACIQALNPLPTVLNPLRPTTGYDDVKSVAIARLAAPSIPVVQVDWLRYGPKLAQVALTFGADDIDGVSPSDESPDGRRRAPLEEVRRNVEAAGFVPAERDGRFALVGLDAVAPGKSPATPGASSR
jgi:aminodeoxyfutalosine synthase